MVLAGTLTLLHTTWPARLSSKILVQAPTSLNSCILCAYKTSLTWMTPRFAASRDCSPACMNHDTLAAPEGLAEFWGNDT
jgi:hypothetical protein